MLEVGKLEVKEQAVSIYPLVNRLYNSFESHAQQKGVRLIFDYQPDTYLHLLLDQDKFEKIIINLLSNAIKFTPENGTVQLQLAETANQLIVKVIDTGRGIHEADLPYLFDRYYQAKHAGADFSGGTGIGLALCKQYVELMQGTITVESRPKQGATFTVKLPKKQTFIYPENSLSPTEEELPIVPLEAHSEEVSSADESAVADILLVEDNPNMDRYMQMVLEDKYRVRVAANGKKALERLGERLPELIVSDVMMPEMDGLALVCGTKRRIKRL